MEAPSNGAAADGDAVMTDAQQSSTALQNEYESIPDADLDAAERKVLEMLEYFWEHMYLFYFHTTLD